jgi:hypothetical protein
VLTLQVVEAPARPPVGFERLIVWPEIESKKRMYVLSNLMMSREQDRYRHRLRALRTMCASAACSVLARQNADDLH